MSDEAGNVVNTHARRLRRQPVALDQAGKKKPRLTGPKAAGQH